MKKNCTFLSIAFLLFFHVAHAQIGTLQIQKLDSIYQKALVDWDVPGMAIAIVSQDTVWLSKGYGFTDISSRNPVDNNTLFALASNTKAFTATSLAMLVDRGQLNWDDKVIDHMPWFALYDPYVTAHMTVEDLLCHRSGLATFSGDLIWYASTYSREEVIRKARYLKPVHGFRTQFGYSNIMYITAGELIPAITGISWDDFVQKEILDALGMQRSLLHVSDLHKRDNIAQPHTYLDGKLLQIPWLDWNNMAPAGSLISSANDMSKWLQLNLKNGIFGQDTLVSSRQMFNLQSPRTVLNVSQGSSKMFPSTHFKAYGLGWTLMDYLGNKIVSHNGGYDGMISQTVFIPEANIGFVIMTNALSTMYYPLMYQTLDILLDNPEQKDWNGLIFERIKSGEELAKNAREEAEKNRLKNTHPTLSPEAYTGVFGGLVYDSIQVSLEKNDLVLQFMRSPLFNGKLKHWQHDTYEISFESFPSLPKGLVTFKINRYGNVSGMEIFLDNPDFDFTEFDLQRLPGDQ